jgi:type I restriction enzyme S subunit
MGNLQDGEIDWTNLVYTNDAGEGEKYMLHEGDVLFNRTNSQAHVGKTSIFDGKMPAIFAGYLIRVTPKKEKLTNEFLNHYLNSDVAREYGRSVMGKSVNQANISGSKLKTYPINLPKLERQHEITLELDTLKVKVQEMQALYRSKLQDISDLRQSLLQKAFAGELT